MHKYNTYHAVFIHRLSLKVSLSKFDSELNMTRDEMVYYHLNHPQYLVMFAVVVHELV